MATTRGAIELGLQHAWDRRGEHEMVNGKRVVVVMLAFTRLSDPHDRNLAFASKVGFRTRA